MAVRKEIEKLAELIRELPDGLLRITEEMRKGHELLRLAVTNLQRDAESKNRLIEAVSHRTADMGKLVENLADVTTKVTVIEPLVVRLEGSNTEHPEKKPEKE